MQLEEQEMQLDEQARALAELQQTVQEFAAEQEEEQLQMQMQLEQSQLRADSSPELAKLLQEIEEKDRKLAQVKGEFEVKREEFRKTMDSLQNDAKETAMAYESKLRAMETDLQQAAEVFEQVEFLSQRVSELESGLKTSQRSEEDAKERLSQLAGIENKLLEKELELKEASERVREYRDMVKAQGASSDESSLEAENARLLSELEIARQNNVELAKLKSNLDVSQNTCKKLEDEIALLKADDSASSALQDQIQSLTADKKQLSDKVEQLELDLASSKSEKSNLLSTIEANTARIAELESLHTKYVESTEKELAELRAKGNSDTASSATIEELKQKLKSSEQETIQLMNDVESLDRELTQLQRENERLKSSNPDEVESLRQELEKMEILVERKILRETELESEIEQLKKTPPKSTLQVDVKPEPETVLAHAEPVAMDTAVTSRPASQGKEAWCGICDKYGHSSVDCPNDDDEEF